MGIKKVQGGGIMNNGSNGATLGSSVCSMGMIGWINAGKSKPQLKDPCEKDEFLKLLIESDIAEDKAEIIVCNMESYGMEFHKKTLDLIIECVKCSPVSGYVFDSIDCSNSQTTILLKEEPKETEEPKEIEELFIEKEVAWYARKAKHGRR